MIKKKKTKVAIESLDEVPFCRGCCNKWAECKGQDIRKCGLIKTILKLQEQKHGVVYTIGGKPVNIF